MASNSQKPTIGITMGDAAGIGPEVTLKALTNQTVRDVCRPVIVGDLAFLRKSAQNLGLAIELVKFGADEQGDAIAVVDLNNLPEEFKIGEDDAICGKAAAEYIVSGVDLWRKGLIDAISTAPISKKAIALGGYNYPGHTEFLAELTGTSDFAMSFFAGKLRVVLLSTHISLRAAIEAVQTDALADLIRFTNRKLSELLKRKVSIAVAGLNPHASEFGMFGSEEKEQIEPAILLCRDENIDVSGPFSPDTIFLRGFNGEFDIVVACYHDQATIAVKSLSFGSSVNVTLGLPLIRTSVDHGTAFDIAGKGIADASSMQAAIILAAELKNMS